MLHFDSRIFVCPGGKIVTGNGCCMYHLQTKLNFRGPNESVPHIICSPEESCLAGKNTGVSMSWLGNFVIDRGFAWELLTFLAFQPELAVETLKTEDD